MKYPANWIAAACYTVWISEGEQNAQGHLNNGKSAKKKVRIYNAHPAPMHKPLPRVTPTRAKLQGEFGLFLTLAGIEPRIDSALVWAI